MGKLKFEKMYSTGHACDDREMAITRDGKMVGSITAYVDNVESRLSPEWRVVSYGVQVWDENGTDIVDEVVAVRSQGRHGEWVEARTARKALSMAKAIARSAE